MVRGVAGPLPLGLILSLGASIRHHADTALRLASWPKTNVPAPPRSETRHACGASRTAEAQTMTIKSKIQSASTETLRALIASRSTGSYEREVAIREIQKRLPNPPGRKPGRLTQDLLDSQWEWIESL